MIFRVEHFGGPEAGETLTVERNKLRDIKKVSKRKPMTRMADANTKPDAKDLAEYFGIYHLRPMMSDGVRYFMYVYEDSLDEFNERYAS